MCESAINAGCMAAPNHTDEALYRGRFCEIDFPPMMQELFFIGGILEMTCLMIWDG